MAAALAAECSNGLTATPAPPECFTAALLHDVGKLVLGRYVDDEIRDFLRRARAAGGRSEAAAESERLNVNHAELGGLIAAHWDLPEAICVGVRWHHDPQDCQEEEELARVAWHVHLADLVAQRLGHGTDDVIPEEAEFAPALQALGMEATQLDELLERTERRIEDVGERFH